MSNEGAFDFELRRRNALLASKGATPPTAWKTGTTIVGLVYKDGVVLAADTRSTSGATVADKNCEKIHRIADAIHCCGAGTAADTMSVTAMVSSSLALHSYATGRPPRVAAAMTLLKSHLFRFQGHVGAALILGGVDAARGPQLFAIYPHGSSDALPYAAMGSGSLNAMAMLEDGYADGLSEADAVALATRAVRAGVLNDLGSGSNIDVCIIDASGTARLTRGVERHDTRTYARTRPTAYARGTAPVIAENLVVSAEA